MFSEPPLFSWLLVASVVVHCSTAPRIATRTIGGCSGKQLQKAFRSAVELLRFSITDPELETAAEGSAIGNAPWNELCDLLGMQDSDILEAGKSEDPRLLRLRADLSEASMATIEGIVAESKQKDVAISNQAEDLAIARSEIQIERLREELALLVSRPREARSCGDSVHGQQAYTMRMVNIQLLV